MTLVYHGLPISPLPVLTKVCPGKALCVSFASPRNVGIAEDIASHMMYDNGAYSLWRKAGFGEWHSKADWSRYYEWLEPRLFHDRRWAVIPDSPGAPSELDDALLLDWPFGNVKGAAVWHMDQSITRMLDLCDKYDLVCFGWTGARVGEWQYRRRMEEVSAALGNFWPKIHMLRGILVAHDYPFLSADSTTFGRNGWKYDYPNDHYGAWKGRFEYIDALERFGTFRGGRKNMVPLNRADMFIPSRGRRWGKEQYE